MRQDFCRVFLGLVLFLWFLPGGIQGENQVSNPRVIAKQEYLDLANVSTRLSWEQLLDLSLNASGTKDFDSYRTRIKIYVQDLRKLTEPLSSDYEKGEEILHYIFRFFSNYKALQTSFNVMLDTGIYNCVSSALLYTVLARALGLKATGVGTYEHAFVNLELSDGRHIDVETTTEYGFDPGQRKEFLNTFTSTTGLVYVPKKNYNRREDLYDTEFLSLILQNRLYILNQSSQDYRTLGKMIPLASDLATLTQAEGDIQNFFSMVSQYSFYLSKSGKLDQALRFTTGVLETYGRRESLLKVRNTIGFNDVLRAIKAGEYRRAEKSLSAYQEQNLLFAASEKELRFLLRQNQIAKTVNALNIAFAKKLEVVQQAEGSFSREKQAELYQVIYSNEVNRLLSQNQFHEATLILHSYPKQKSAFFHKLQNAVEETYVVDIYNRSAKNINQKAYGKAELALKEGLDHYPNNSRLLKLQEKLAEIKPSAG